MIGKFLGADVPACGFSIGFERLDSIFADRPVLTTIRRIVLLHDAEAATPELDAAAAILRAEGDVVRREVATRNRNAQLERFAEAGFTHWAEYRSGDMTVQPLSGDDQ